MTGQVRSPHPRAGEIVIGMVALYWGAAVSIWPNDPGLSWAGLDYETARWRGIICILSSILLAIGCRVNGMWRYSPVVRAAGLAGIASVSGQLAFAAFGTSGSTWAIYSGATAACVSILVGTAIDAVAVLKRGGPYAARH
ncbi:hypothetical protein [Oceanicella actignis]|uniref:hypothetical protein n=1 Tax=Oceanicella actignis TaxID=1189325 RepID=UPI0011E863EF|nr:hypothetical protein [Oceanicella actignis]TYO91424.1 hypothetical protein LY05_00277 [Oceanicella actignis]